MDGRRSRSNSYDDRSPRRKHRKRKHKSRRSRSRSRSRSREYDRPATSSNHRIHINPAFGLAAAAPPQPPQMGYSASQLLQNNNFLEAEVQRLKAAILEEQGRCQIQYQQNQMMSNEMRNLTAQRDDARKQMGNVMNERRSMMDARSEMANRINILDVANRQLREDVAMANLAVDGKNEEVRALLYQADIVQQQIAGLNERNASLKAKCEATVGKNRQLLDEINAKHAFYENFRLNAQKAEADLQLANMEIKRLHREIENAQTSDRAREENQKAIEAALKRKEDELRVSSHKSAQALKKATDTIEKLENKLRSDRPMVTDDLSVFQEAIYVTIEAIKTTYEKQLSRLEEEVEALKNDKLRDHLHDEGDVQPEAENIDQLPTYLQTPQKPDPSKMDNALKTNQVKIKLEPILERSARATSGPPMDSPVTWHQQKTSAFEAPVSNGDGGESQPSKTSSVPLFGTTRLNSEKTVKVEEEETEEDVEMEAGPSTSSALLDAPGPSEVASGDIHIDTESASQELNEEDLLGDPTDMISPIQNLEAIEKQLLDEP